MGEGLKDFLEKRNELLEEIIEKVKKRKKDGENLVELLDNLKDDFISLEELSKLIGNEGYTQAYGEKLEELSLEYKKIIEDIDIEKQRLKENMLQINKKDEVVDNYISKKRPPIFIDKDL